MEKHIYLDYNASTPIAHEVIDVMTPLLSDYFGNPSAIHWAGTPLKKLLNQAREQVADLLSCNPHEIIFTSGGSESNNFALKGIYFKQQNKGKHIITSKIEHPAILNPCKFLEGIGANITYVDVDQYGRVSPEEIEKAITKETILISIMHSNNEVGTLQPIKEIGKIAKRYGIPFHTDASQSVGKVPVNVEDLGVDLLTVAGHKLYAPKGIGALYIRDGLEIEPLIHGAGHEFAKRAGTESTILAVGLGKACELAQRNLANSQINELSDYFWLELKNILGDQVVLNGHPKLKLPNTLNVSFVHKSGQAILDSMPEIAASTGSACHSGHIDLSLVLKEMKVPEHIGMGTIRFSLGIYSTRAEIDYVLNKLQAIL
ncbi:cysteine desulfurase family protein [Bacillus marasmi]|uniref:cysteine desulfurase family protein n=1 Tax=Bacillus marasmi TaxID=1926279 RepID=UPI0011C952B7|nr:cysteine desulfurase family protein [Bacillus marasmi]